MAERARETDRVRVTMRGVLIPVWSRFLFCALVLLGTGCGQNDRHGANMDARTGDGVSATDSVAPKGQSLDAGSGSVGSRVSDGARSELPESRAASGLRPRVVMLGTSLTAGLGLPPDMAYPALLQHMADSAGYRVELVNAGLSGETSAGAVRRVGWVLERPAALVVLEVGANDGLRGVEPDSTYANLLRVVDSVRVKQADARVVLVQMEAPTNLGPDYTARFRGVYERAARARSIPLWPFLLEGVAGIAALNQADGIHPNAAGERLVALNVWRSLEPELRRLGSERR